MPSDLLDDGMALAQEILSEFELLLDATVGGRSVKVLLQGTDGQQVSTDKTDTNDRIIGKLFDTSISIDVGDTMVVGNRSFLVNGVKGIRRTPTDNTRYLTELRLVEVD